MGMKERITKLEQKAGGTDSVSMIPRHERVVAVSGYTPEERDEKMKARMAEMHEKYGDFDERCIIKVSIRKFCKPEE